MAFLYKKGGWHNPLHSRLVACILKEIQVAEQETTHEFIPVENAFVCAYVRRNCIVCAVCHILFARLGADHFGGAGFVLHHGVPGHQPYFLALSLLPKTPALERACARGFGHVPLLRGKASLPQWG